MKNESSSKDSVNDCKEDEGIENEYVIETIGGTEDDDTSASKEETTVGSADPLIEEVGKVTKAVTFSENSGATFEGKKGFDGDYSKGEFGRFFGPLF